MQNSRLRILLYGRHGAEMPQRVETWTESLAGGHTRTVRLDRDLCAIVRSCGTEGVVSTRAARTDVAVWSNILIVSARLANLASVNRQDGNCFPRLPVSRSSKISSLFRSLL